MKTDPKALERQRKYEKRMEEKDLIRVTLWVPRSMRGELIYCASKLRKFEKCRSDD